MGGAERLVRGLHLGLLEEGVESRVLGLERHEDDAMDHAVTLGLASSKSVKAFLGIKNYLKNHCQEGDIVHAHLFPSNLYCGFLHKYAKGPLVTTEHSTSNRRRGTMRGRVMDGLIYKAYDRIACISEGTERALVSWMTSCEGKTQVVRNGTKLHFDHFFEREASDCPVVISVGRLVVAKNYEVALKAVSLLGDIPFEYWIVGEGEERLKLERLIRELDLADRVKLLGYVADPIELLKQADLFLIPSLWEGFGLAAVEAMNAGLPIVASDVDGLREVVGVDGECGMLVDPQSSKIMAEALGRYLNIPDLRQIHGAKAHQRSQQFSEIKIINNYVRFYREIQQINDGS